MTRKKKDEVAELHHEIAELQKQIYERGGIPKRPSTLQEFAKRMKQEDDDITVIGPSTPMPKTESEICPVCNGTGRVVPCKNEVDIPWPEDDIIITSRPNHNPRFNSVEEECNAMCAWMSS